MSETVNASGTCLCGSVTIKAETASKSLGACHCRICRTWGGGPFLGIGCGDAVEIDGEDSVTVFDSSEWAERGFCKTCGTHLFYRIKGKKDYHIPAALLSSESYTPTFDSQIFIDSKPENYSFANETKNLTGAEVFAMFAPKE